MIVWSISVESMIALLMEIRAFPIFLRYAIIICIVISKTLLLNCVSNVFTSAMESHATYDRVCNTSHGGLISQVSSADVAASWVMSALIELLLASSTVAASEWKVVWGEGFSIHFGPCQAYSPLVCELSKLCDEIINGRSFFTTFSLEYLGFGGNFFLSFFIFSPSLSTLPLPSFFLIFLLPFSASLPQFG